jgi:multisubunit Na+/H+ antiporter MnhC subunit
MIVVIATIRSVTYFSQNDTSFAYTPFEADESESSGQKFGGALLNALIIIAIVVAMTFFLLLLYKYECYKVFNEFLTLFKNMCSEHVAYLA